MSRAPKLVELEALTDSDLREAVDAHAENVEVSLTFYMEELRRREVRQQTKAMRYLTWALVGM